MKNYWGFDLRTIDQHVRPQDDFYRYANGGWMSQVNIPDDEPRWGTFSILRYETEQKLKTIIEILLNEENLTRGTSEQLVADLYRSAIDTKRRNSLGIDLLKELILKIRNINSTKDIVSYLADASHFGIPGIWSDFVDQDAKNSNHYMLHFFQSGLGMPEREYYLNDELEQKRVRDAYQLHIAKLMKLAGKSEKETKQIVEIVMKIETRLAKTSMAKEERREVEKTYHKLSLGEFSDIAPNLEIGRFVALLGIVNLKECIVAQPDFFREVSHMMQEIPIIEWKTYLEFHLLNGSARFLSIPFVEENFDFYGRTLTGQREMKPEWRRALGMVNGGVGEALGVLYVEKYFDENAKKRIDAIVDDLFTAYSEHIRVLEWMSQETKQKALKKLEHIVRKIAYPSRLKGYPGLDIGAEDFFGNILRVNEFEHARSIEKLVKPIDREEWFMDPQDVNAYFSPSMNDIVFPAAILQAPFFDNSSEDEAVNYAAIGAVIGHELTHGFDDQGSKFDEEGNMNNWWSENDKKKFEEKTQILVKQFDQYNVAPGVSVNGKLTLGENIADLGGLSIAFDAYKKHLAMCGREDIDGFTPEQRFFLGFAQAEREIEREESLKTSVMTDPHSPGIFRVNGPLSNFDPFYDAFNVREGDGLYRKPEERARIW